MDLNTEFLRSIKAKYVACTKERLISNIPSDRAKYKIIPQYSIVWTDMEIDGAPDNAVIKWYYLDGNTVHFECFALNLVVIVEKIEEDPSKIVMSKLSDFMDQFSE